MDIFSKKAFTNSSTSSRLSAIRIADRRILYFDSLGKPNFTLFTRNHGISITAIRIKFKEVEFGRVAWCCGIFTKAAQR